MTRGVVPIDAKKEVIFTGQEMVDEINRLRSLLRRVANSQIKEILWAGDIQLFVVVLCDGDVWEQLEEFRSS